MPNVRTFLILWFVATGCGDQPDNEAAAPVVNEPAAPEADPAHAEVAPAEPGVAVEPPTEPTEEPSEATPTQAAPEKPVGTSRTSTGEAIANKGAAPEAKPVAVEPAPEPATPPKAETKAEVAATDDGPCGEDGQPMCPLQAFMERTLQHAMEIEDLPALAKGLSRAAKLAPAPSWNEGASGWSAIALAGADAAAAGDAAAAKQSCKTCHKAFRKDYKAEFRKKPL